MVGGAALLRHLERAHPEAPGEPLGELKGRRARARDRTRGAGELSPTVWDRLQRVDGERLGASLARRLQGVEGGGAADVADEAQRRQRRGRSSRRRRRSRRRGRTAGRPRLRGRPRGPVAAGELHWHPGEIGCGCDRDAPALPGPITASGGRPAPPPGRGGDGEISFQFSHRRYQTAVSGRLLMLAGWPGPRPAGRGHGPSIGWYGSGGRRGYYRRDADLRVRVRECGTRFEELSRRGTGSARCRECGSERTRARLLSSGAAIRTGEDPRRGAKAGAQERPAPSARAKQRFRRRSPGGPA